ncbi:MAG: YcaO-related McrA-glycine thioamidation protein [Candidatus Methanofastidiosia archaeon]
MELSRCRKKYIDTTHRVIDPEETYTRIKNKMSAIGVTNVEEITHLDRIGIPVFISCRTVSNGNEVQVYNGKGTTAIEAKVSAMMEAIERQSSELNEDMVTIAVASQLPINYIRPASLVLPNPYSYSEGMTIGWTKGFNLVDKQDVYIPSNAVFHPFPPRYGWIFRSNTNGLASGNCIEESILHALCEVIERDAWSLAEIVKRTPFDVEIDTNDNQICKLIDKFSDADVELGIKDITSDLGIPTFVAVSDDVKLKDPTLLNIGVGTHLDPRVALLRAITEVAQSRLTQIKINSENPNASTFKRRLGYDRIKRMNKMWYSSSDQKLFFSETTSLSTEYMRDDIEALVNILSSKGFPIVSVVDLTNKDVDVSVVRVVVPGLEQCYVDADRIGNRARTLLK